MVSLDGDDEIMSATEEDVPFLQDESVSPPPYTSVAAHNVPTTEDQNRREEHLKRRLYISHFLSTWNSRTFEFAALLVVARLFQETLLPVSIYALFRAASAICFAPYIGRYVDCEDRLKTVRTSIIGQRLAVFLWLAAVILASIIAGTRSHFHTGWDIAVSLLILVPFGCMEKLCSIMNLIAIERDWVVVIAENTQCELEVLNSQMRRIDLACKLLGPLSIALIDGFSPPLALLAIFIMNLISVFIEYIAIAKVYQMIPALASYRPNIPSPPTSSPTQTNPSLSRHPLTRSLTQLKPILQTLSFYTHHPAFLPSLSLSLLYLTVLSFSGQMITYLLSVDDTKPNNPPPFSTTRIGLLRTLAAMSEMLATWLAPAIMRRIGPTRTGLWAINWQAACAAGGIGLFWFVSPTPVAAVGLVVGVILSRVGLWGFDLSVQILVQEAVEPPHRGSFSSLEASLQNFFELCAYASTIAFPHPDQFKFPVLLSGVVVVLSWALYVEYVRRTRGHLIHLSRCWEWKKGEVERGTSLRLRELP